MGGEEKVNTVKSFDEYVDEQDIRLWKKKPVIVRATELKERIRIETREGELFGEPGDFLVEGVEKEIYPCGKEIFFKTYEAVE